MKQVIIYSFGDIFPSIRIGECVDGIRVDECLVDTGFVTSVGGNGCFETDRAIFMPKQVLLDDVDFQAETYGRSHGG